jgi:hypothetical protein
MVVAVWGAGGGDCSRLLRVVVLVGGD